MIDVIRRGSKKIVSWCSEVEDGAMEQAVNVTEHSCLVGHVALLPDCHQGYGMPIGCVAGFEDAVVPYAVGSDIGCGMMATRFEVATMPTKTDIEDILSLIKRMVPIISHKTEEAKHCYSWLLDSSPFVLALEEKAMVQLGTLGRGNHFIELQAGDDGCFWVMVHSGSRNLGKMIATYHLDVAVAYCDYFDIPLPDEKLAFLPTGTTYGKDYLRDMMTALAYAHDNRTQIMASAILAVKEVLKKAKKSDVISSVHNTACQETHFGKSVWVHRKGATTAHKGQTVIIPGSMGTSSYIGMGQGNRLSYDSCSHGAGRVMSRSQASKTLNQADCEASMAQVVFAGWGVDRKGRVDLGEAPQAYKDIDMVMTAQRDLVTPLVSLRPMGVVKG